MEGEEGEEGELLKSDKLHAWTRVQVQECSYAVRQENEDQKSIVQQILHKSSDFPRRIIAPVQGQGGVTLSYACLLPRHRVHA